MKEGAVGEFTVKVDGQVVARKGLLFLPSDRKILQAVRLALAQA